MCLVLLGWLWACGVESEEFRVSKCVGMLCRWLFSHPQRYLSRRCSREGEDDIAHFDSNG